MKIKASVQIDPKKTEDILKRVSESRCFGRSERQLNLFKYLLEKTALGESARIKQYVIALDVFDRPSSFDQQTDSIVRVEMHRLRQNLSIFNEQSQSMRISIPKGRFDVVVEDVEPEKFSSGFSFRNLKKRQWIIGAILLGVSSISVQGFLNFADSEANDLSACSQFLPNISVVLDQSADMRLTEIERSIKNKTSQYTHFNLVDEDCRSGATPALQLHYASATSDVLPAIYVTHFGKPEPLVFHQFSEGSAIDNGVSFDYNLAQGLALILKPYGSLSNNLLLETWSSPEAELQYRCLVDMHLAYGTGVDADYFSVHKCLENATASGAKSFEIEGGLAASYLEQYIGNYEPADPDAFRKAKEILEAHERDWINSAELSLAKMMFEANRPDYSVDRFRGVVSRVAERYDSNPQVLLTAAGYMGFWIGDWESASKWSTEGRKIHADRDHSVYLVDAAYVLITSKNSDVRDVCLKAYSENSALTNIIVNACARKNNDEALVRLTEKNLHALGLGSTSARTIYIEGKNFEPSITKNLIKLNSNSIKNKL